MSVLEISQPAPADPYAALQRSGLLDTPGDARFGKLTGFVQDMLDVPVSVVSLVNDERQVFLGHCGLPQRWADAGETPLTHSFCQHVVDRGAPLIVDESILDPLVRENLAIRDIGVAAYLGVPLRLPTGELVGALAAIDTVPRKWTGDDLRRLTSIAGMVEAEIAGRASETRWRTLFNQLREGFIVGKVLRDATGRIHDWRYLDVNKAWSELLDIPVERAIGRTIREVLPGIEDAWVDEFAEVVETGLPKQFTRQVGRIDRWYDGYAQATGPETFVVMFVEVTERVKADAERAQKERQLRTLVESVPVGVLLAEAPSGRIVMTNERLADILGHDTALVATADRYERIAAFHEDGRPFAPSEFPLARIVAGETDHVEVEMHYARPSGDRVWISVVGEAVKDAEGRTNGAVVAVADVGNRKRQEAQQRVLNYELAHRLKNTLAVVASIATQTIHSSPDLDTAQRSLSDRILTLSRAHDILLVGREDAGGIGEIVRGAVAVHDPAGRIRLDGPDVLLGPKAALALALICHELATNAGKYGALSVEDGRVDVRWRIEGDAEPTLAIEWRETGGPPVVAPTRRGFGSRMIRTGLPGPKGGSVEVDYAPDGLRCRIVSPLSDVSHVPETAE